MPSKETFDRAVSVVLAAGVLVATVILIEGRINPRPPMDRPTYRTEFVKDWRERSAASAVALGDSDAPVQIVIFTDFACPFCKQLDSVISQVEIESTKVISHSVVHFPVARGAGSRDAALAFECASEQARAREMSTQLYATREDFSAPKLLLASMVAGVPDSAAFVSCLESRRLEGRVEAGVAWANDLELVGTPAVLVNGWLIEPSTPARIRQAIADIRSGKDPSRRNGT